MPGQAIVHPFHPRGIRLGALLVCRTYIPSLLFTHSLSLTDLVFNESLTCALCPSGDTQMTKAWSAHRWGDGSEDPAIVHVNVGSPVSFPALLLKPPMSAAVCPTTSFLSFRASCDVALNSMRW